MKIYPRHQLDIELSDLCAGLLSYFILLNRNQIEKEIQSFGRNKKHVRVCFTVRTALDILLSALNLPEGSRSIDECHKY